MAIWNLGSINIDYAYAVPHIPAPGETLAATSRQTGLGGKGANMSMAIARAGCPCYHIGAIGTDGLWTRDRLAEAGVDTRFIQALDAPTGHAIVNVSADGENAITLLPGPNHLIPDDLILGALDLAQPGDWLLMQNETNNQSLAARTARAQGLRIAYAAAPFDVDATQQLLPQTDLLILNEIEMQQLHQATGQTPATLGVETVIVTMGAKGAMLFTRAQEYEPREFPALPVTPVDTTGAGDTFTGYLLAALDQGRSLDEAMQTASRAGALMVTRLGTADVIPTLQQVLDFAP